MNILQDCFVRGESARIQQLKLRQSQDSNRHGGGVYLQWFCNHYSENKTLKLFLSGAKPQDAILLSGAYTVKMEAAYTVFQLFRNILSHNTFLFPFFTLYVSLFCNISFVLALVIQEQFM